MGLGSPKYDYYDIVEFDLNEIITGYIYIIDAFGTFECNNEVCYDIYAKEKNCLYKHIPESWIIRKVGVAPENETF